MARDIPTPKTHKEALESEYSEMWATAVAEELHNLRKHDVWQWVDPPKNAPLVDARWVFKAKSSNSGIVSRFKARLVAKGYKQREQAEHGEGEGGAPKSPIGFLRLGSRI